MKTKLFISYASEDEVDFVRPLAETLAADFDVWFAPYKLTMGDSLLRKISQGLRECDYGVVVLSPHFFAKEWPKNELDGLFGLETEERKVILPIWKDVTKEDVARFSPILAGRLSARASRGIAAAVDEIKAAVGAGNRMASFSAESALKAQFLSLDAESANHERAKLLRNTPEGIPLVSASAAKTIGKLEELIHDLQSRMARLKLTVTRRHDSIFVHASRGGVLRVNYSTPYTNCILDSIIGVIINDLPGSFNSEGDFQADHEPLVVTSFKPDFAPGDAVVWRADDGRQFTGELLALHILSMFHDVLRTQLGEAKALDEERRR